MEEYVYKLNGKRYVQGDGNSFSRQDFSNPGFLISTDGNLMFQHGPGTSLNLGAY